MNKINLGQLARTFAAYQNCVKAKNEEWEIKHETAIFEMCKNLPHGSGLDGAMIFCHDLSTPEKLVFFFEFHHMDENGYYDGWTEHNLIITPSLQFGYNMRITGRNKGDVKTYLYDLFSEIFE
jgi:hypothetical protein